ncbi:unnamed protein product [Periconia digitata]|uniref:Uncharacterized protein n=1 Tax=Periconia digitata TaxID=1303443 RepID=A0A9W4UUD4_9PLEO|nr:unnamed protein product [Periconia digitata]
MRILCFSFSPTSVQRAPPYTCTFLTGLNVYSEPWIRDQPRSSALAPLIRQMDRHTDGLEGLQPESRSPPPPFIPTTFLQWISRSNFLYLKNKRTVQLGLLGRMT